jgi:hypothetical protein
MFRNILHQKELERTQTQDLGREFALVAHMVSLREWLLVTRRGVTRRVATLAP